MALESKRILYLTEISQKEHTNFFAEIAFIEKNDYFYASIPFTLHINRSSPIALTSTFLVIRKRIPDSLKT